MVKQILAYLGFRTARRAMMRERYATYGRRAGLPVGGLLSLAFFAWQNRDELKSLYERYVAPRLPQGEAHA